MKTAAILFLAAAVLPVFFSKNRSAPFWLAFQALALAWAGLASHGDWNGHTLPRLIEVLGVRGLIAPILLHRAIRGRAEPNLDLMPSNLFVWAIAITLIVLAFQFGAPAMDERNAITLGAIGATVVVSLLLLASNESPPAQLVAVLFMENALALFESLLPEPWPLPVHAALGIIYVATVAVGSWLIGEPDHAGATDAMATAGDAAREPRQ